MKIGSTKQMPLYRFRYQIGFGIVGIFIILLATYKFWQLPNGLSAGEVDSLTISGHFSPVLMISQFYDHLGWIINLPWTALQWLSLEVFGIGVFGARLPAVLLTALSGVGIALILRKWTRPNIAVISTFLAVTSVMFISLSRSGTAAAMMTFLIVASLLSATVILYTNRKHSFRILLAKIAVGISLALMLYQPGGVYVVFAFCTVGFLHPKIRLLFVRTKTWKIMLGALAGLVVISPLVAGIILQLLNSDFSIAKELFVLNGSLSIDGLKSAAIAMFGIGTGQFGGLITPPITLVGLMIAMLGLARVTTDIFSARAYLILPFTLIAVILTVVKPEMIYLIFIPLVLLTTVGLEVLVYQWYSLFPRNPYARIFALFPLTILVLGLGWTSILRFNSIVNYSGEAPYYYNQEFQATVDWLHSNENKPVHIVALNNQVELYRTLKNNFDNLTVSDGEENADNKTNLVLHSTKINLNNNPKQIVSSSLKNNPILLSIY